jgi:hypothetical protein
MKWQPNNGRVMTEIYFNSASVNLSSDQAKKNWGNVVKYSRS